VRGAYHPSLLGPQMFNQGSLYKSFDQHRC
jgi:hypothetical protein